MSIVVCLTMVVETSRRRHCAASTETNEGGSPWQDRMEGPVGVQLSANQTIRLTLPPSSPSFSFAHGRFNARSFHSHGRTCPQPLSGICGQLTLYLALLAEPQGVGVAIFFFYSFCYYSLHFNPWARIHLARVHLLLWYIQI